MDRLTQAIENNDLNLVKKYANKKNINRKNNTPLTLACKNNQTAMIELLVSLGANLRLGDDEAFLLALSCGHVETAKLLLRLDPSLADNNNTLHQATRNDLRSIIELLLEAGADIHSDNDYALREAARNGQTDTVKFLLDHGANINAENDEALYNAAKFGHTETVKFLLDKGADIHAEDNDTLRIAVKRGHAEVTKLLISSGANVNANNNEALRESIKYGDEEITKLLIDSGADAEMIIDKCS